MISKKLQHNSSLVSLLALTALLALIPTTGSASSTASTSAERDLHCLALNIYHEARGESKEGQMAIATVTMNRLSHNKYPDTICQVVWQYRQFSWTHDGRSDDPDDVAAWQTAQKIAHFIYNNYPRLVEITKGRADITNGALYYYAPKLADPYWAKHKVVTRTIGDHIFLKDTG
ncbi:MAG: cell wall hydrolase [Gammaproteobacteria bacterium]|nr:cell wall hydrolase [Gammaproteobacteria bacterium]